AQDELPRPRPPAGRGTSAATPAAPPGTGPTRMPPPAPARPALPCDRCRPASTAAHTGPAGPRSPSVQQPVAHRRAWRARPCPAAPRTAHQPRARTPARSCFPRCLRWPRTGWTTTAPEGAAASAAAPSGAGKGTRSLGVLQGAPLVSDGLHRGFLDVDPLGQDGLPATPPRVDHLGEGDLPALGGPLVVLLGLAELLVRPFGVDQAGR